MLELKYKFSKILMNPIVYNDLMVTFIDIFNIKNDPNWICYSHKHTWYEFHYISEGAIYATIEGVEFKVEPGCFYLMPPGCTHSHRHYENTGDTGLVARWLLEKINVPNDYSSYKVADRIIDSFSNFNSRCFIYPADKMLNEIGNVSIEETETALVYWLMNIYRVLTPCNESEQNRQKFNNKDIIVKQIFLCLEKEYSSDITVKDIAASIGYSYLHLSRIFHESTGMSIVEKLNSIRMAKAIDLLENTNLSIGAICEAVGFRNMAYFSTEFAKYTHLSPTQFRKVYKSVNSTDIVR